MESLLYVYIAGLLVGGVVVVLSALGGLGGDVDAGDVGMDTDISADASAGSSISVLSFLRIRLLFYFAFFFGLTGLVGSLTMGPLTTLITALGIGAFLAWLGDWIVGRMARSSTSSGLEPEDYIGLEARVTVPIAAGGRGKIISEVRGQMVELLAQTSREGVALKPGARVLVLELQDGVALVDPE